MAGDVLTRLRQDQAQAMNALAANAATVLIVELNPHARETLIAALVDLQVVQGAGDKRAMEYLAKVVEETLRSASSESLHQAKSLSTFAAGLSKNKRFRQKYSDLKAEAGFSTIKDVANAAGLSEATVHSIESGKRRPQSRTLQALARAFGVDVSELMPDR